MDKKFLIVSSFIFVLAIVGVTLIAGGITGNTITGASIGVAGPEVENEYFRIDDFGSELNKEVKNDTQNISGSR